MSAHSACPFCGAHISAQARYCDRCGTPLKQEDSPAPLRRRTRSAHRGAVWVFVLVLFVTLVGGAAAGFRYRVGYWPSLIPPRTVAVVAPITSPTAAVDLVAAKQLRSVVAINARGAAGNRTGSGFLIDSAGHVATVAHVVEGATCTTVYDDDGRAHVGAVLGRDQNLDIALLSVPELATWPDHLDLGVSSGLKLKEPLLVLGSSKGAGAPVALAATLTRTGVSQTTEDGHYYANLLQIAGATVREGTSGGPLVDKASGNVVGVIAAASSSPIAFAIPVGDVEGLFRQWSALPSPSCTAGPAAQTIRLQLAAIVPFSGAYGVEGTDLAAGVQLALKDMSPALLAAGYNVTLKKYDDQSTVFGGRDAGSAAAYDPSVIGVVGSLDGKTTDAIARSLEPSGLVMVAPTAGSADLTTHGWNFFNRLGASAMRQEQASAKFAADRLKSKAVYIIDDGSVDAAQQEATFVQAAQIISLPIVGTYKLPVNWDYGDVKMRLTEFKADAVFYAGGSDTALMLATAMRQDGLMLPILGGQALLDPRFGKLNKPGDKGIYFTRLTAEPSESFKRYFESSLGTVTRYGAYGYDAAGVILTALLRYGETHPGQPPTRLEMARLVRETSGYSGWASGVTFDGTGENLSSWIYIYEWNHGVPEYRDYLK